MSQKVRTICFVAVAAVCLGIGLTTHSMNQPIDLDAFVDVGKPFYPNFNDPNEATGMRVASFNEATSQTDVFSVELKNGLWRIPSHHDYPADGKDQLAKTAASMIGVERQALIERTKAAHKRYDLLDPLDKDVIGTEGRGDRITLYKKDESLVDFIVGKPVEGQQNVYYVRAADEDRFYTANLGDFEISTKFTDWIDKDILDIQRNNVREVIVNRYRIDESRGVLIQGDRLTLQRPSSTETWKLDGLDESKEELEVSNVNTIVQTLDELSIVGVRNKPAGISADLKAEPGKGVSTTRFDMLDLQEKGFFIDPREGGGILSNEGEVLVGTNDGVLYVLRFGEEFSGSEVEIEVGNQGDKTAGETSEEPKSATDSKETTPDEPSATPAEDSLLKSRYLFVTAQFDEELLGLKPVPPVKPEPPTQAENPAASTSSSASDTEAKPEANTKANTEAITAKEPPAADADAPDAVPDPQKAYEDALKNYEEEQEVFEIKLKDYEKKLATGQERVLELNRRFADWYYVISADVFNRMKINRVDLVKAKETPAEENPVSPENPLAPEKPATPTTSDTPATSEKPVMKQPTADKETPAENPSPKAATENDSPQRPETPSKPEPIISDPEQKPQDPKPNAEN